MNWGGWAGSEFDFAIGKANGHSGNRKGGTNAAAMRKGITFYCYDLILP